MRSTVSDGLGTDKCGCCAVSAGRCPGSRLLRVLGHCSRLSGPKMSGSFPVAAGWLPSRSHLEGEPSGCGASVVGCASPAKVCEEQGLKYPVRVFLPATIERYH